MVNGYARWSRIRSTHITSFFYLNIANFQQPYHGWSAAPFDAINIINSTKRPPLLFAIYLGKDEMEKTLPLLHICLLRAEKSVNTKRQREDLHSN